MLKMPLHGGSARQKLDLVRRITSSLSAYVPSALTADSQTGASEVVKEDLLRYDRMITDNSSSGQIWTRSAERRGGVCDLFPPF